MVVDPCTSTLSPNRGVDIPGIAVSPNTSYIGGWYYTGAGAYNFPMTATTAALSFGLICSDAGHVYVLSGQSGPNLTLTQYD